MKIQTLLCCAIISVTTACNKQNQTVTFGVISDVHQDLQHDATSRMKTFVDEANLLNPNFIIDLGDMSHSTGADTILAQFNKFNGQKYLAFGNHDMDNASKQTMIEKYKIPQGHYHFDNNGVRFIVLDCAFTRKNDSLVDYNHGNYFVNNNDRDLITPEQIQWVRNLVDTSNLPTIIFSHQAFDEIGGSVPNRSDFRQMVKDVNTPNKKIVAAICGHHHIDALSVIDGVNYLQINSASYQWIENGKEYSNGRMAEYKDPLYAFITVNPAEKTITVKGKTSEYLAPTPKAEDFSKEWREQNENSNAWQYLDAKISDRTIKW